MINCVKVAMEVASRRQDETELIVNRERCGVESGYPTWYQAESGFPTPTFPAEVLCLVFLIPPNSDVLSV